jgi:hypothetical protein
MSISIEISSELLIKKEFTELMKYKNKHEFLVEL